VAIQQPGDLGEGEPVGKSGHDENAVVVDMFPGPACGCLCRAGRTVPITSLDISSVRFGPALT